MLAEWMSWMADVCLHIPGQTSARHMLAAPQGQPLKAHSVPIEDNICRDGMPDSHRSKCSEETAWDNHNIYHNTHNRHSCDELRIEVPSLNASHQGQVAVVEHQSLSPKSLPRSQFHFRMVSQTPQFRSQKAVLEQKS